MAILSTNLYFDLIIGNLTNFLDQKDLIIFKMVETVGVELPTFEISFRTTSLSIKDKILENNPVSVKIGHDSNSYDTFDVSILAKKVEQNSQSYYNCHIYGYLSGKRFLLDKAIKAVKGTSIQGINEVGADYFNSVISDIDKVKEDPQNWRIVNQSGQKLLTKMWLHMNIAPSFPLIAINRYNQLIVKDFNNLRTTAPKFRFTQKTTSKSSDEIVFLNDFIIENRTHIYNLYAGYGKAVNILDLNSGEYSVSVSGTPAGMLAASQQVEITRSGSRVYNGYYTSDNVHKNYYQAYFYNTARLLQLSNISGFVEFKGTYLSGLQLLDLVNVECTDSDKYNSVTGRYIVDTIEYTLTSSTPFSTKAYLSRDSLNNIENNNLDQSQSQNIDYQTKQTVLETAKKVRKNIRKLRNYLSDDILSGLLSYLTNLKVLTLNSYVILSKLQSFKEQLNSLSSLKNQAKSFLSLILLQYLPANVVNILVGLGNNSSLNFHTILEEYLNQYIPLEIISQYEEIITDIYTIVNTLSAIEKLITNITSSKSYNYVEGNNMLTNNTDIAITLQKTQEKINTITDTIIENTKGIDVPIPIIDITENLQFLNDTQLQDYVVDQTMNSLIYKGYLKSIDLDYFRKIMIGEEILDYNTINIVNSNIGNILYIRHWGTFTNVSDLTDFNIRESYEDKFKTIQTTKTLDARGGKKIFVAVPSIITNLKFLINSSEVIMNTLDINLRYFDVNNNLIDYTVYYTSTGYNSNSCLLEIRQNP